MNPAQKAIFPGILVGILAVIIATRAIISPHASVNASAEEAVPGQASPVDSSEEGSLTQDSAHAQSGCSLSQRYPEKIQRWCDLIQKYAHEHGLEPNLIAAVMLQESGGNPDAYSRSGAVGLMQVMPRDGLAASFQCVNGPCFASRPSMDELFEPEFNISYGVRMLAGLIHRRGDVREGLKSYGPMDVGYGYADKVLAIYENYR